MTIHDLYFTAANYTSADRAYVEAHRFMYGELGERVAAVAVLFRDRLLRPGFVLPVVRLAPVAPYGGCMALSGNSGALGHVEGRGLGQGVWLYLHRKFYDGQGFDETVDATVLHELLHNELTQFGEDPAHKGEPWARRCRELSGRLGFNVSIERPRSVRLPGEKRKVTTRTPPGCLSQVELACWPLTVLKGGPPLRSRVGLIPCVSPLADPAELTIRGEALP